MLYRLLAILIVVLGVVTVSGCNKEEPAEPTEVKVTEENLDSELDKMEAQIEADIAAEE